MDNHDIYLKAHIGIQVENPMRDSKIVRLYPKQKTRWKDNPYWWLAIILWPLMFALLIAEVIGVVVLCAFLSELGGGVRNPVMILSVGFFGFQLMRLLLVITWDQAQHIPSFRKKVSELYLDFDDCYEV